MSERVEEIRRRHEKFVAQYSPGPDWEPCNQMSLDRGWLLAALAQAEAENERLRERHEETLTTLQDTAKNAIRAEARTRALVAALREVWESIPSSHDEADPMVQRHARALNAIPAALTEPTPPAGEQG